jgi:hypothetical protein
MSDPNNERVEGRNGARGAEYQRLVDQRREHERARKREARKRQTPGGESLSASESGKHAFDKRPDSANVKKSGRQSGAAGRRSPSWR